MWDSILILSPAVGSADIIIIITNIIMRCGCVQESPAVSEGSFMSRSVMEFVTGDWGWVVIRGGVEERMGVGLRRSENATKLSMCGGMYTCMYVCMYVRTYV